ncbi:MAG: hypothetical protein WCE21_01050 [Candidatus Babeliales bacterium]
MNKRIGINAFIAACIAQGMVSAQEVTSLNLPAAPTAVNVSFVNSPSYPANIQVGNAYSAPYMNSAIQHDINVAVAALTKMNVQTGAAVVSSMLSTSKQTIKEKAQLSASALTRLKIGMFNNKWKTICATMGTVYLSCLSVLLWHNFTMTRTCYWGMWKKEVPLEVLLISDHDAMAQELITAIHMRYHKNDEPTNFLTPLRRFMDDIEREMAFLNRYIHLWEWTQTMRISRLFPNQTNGVTRARETLKRVQVLAEIFKRWCASYTLQIHGVGQG